MLTHIVCHILQMARPTNFKLDIRMEDGAMTSKVKGKGHKLTSSVRLMPLLNSGNKVLYLCH